MSQGYGQGIGIVVLAGDTQGPSYDNVVTGLQGYHVSNVAPSNGNFLYFNGSEWTTSVAPNITMSGDVTGNSSASVVVAIQGVPVLSTTPTTGQALLFNGTQWSPTSLPSLAGDVTGSIGANTVVQIQGVAVVSTAPTAGQALTFNGTQWSPTSPPSPTVFGGDLSTSPQNQTVVGIQTVPVVVSTPTSGQTLVLNPVALTVPYPIPSGLIARYTPASIQQSGGNVTGWVDVVGGHNLSGSATYDPNSINGLPSVELNSSNYLAGTILTSGRELTYVIVGEDAFSLNLMGTSNITSDTVSASGGAGYFSINSLGNSIVSSSSGIANPCALGVWRHSIFPSGFQALLYKNDGSYFTSGSRGGLAGTDVAINIDLTYNGSLGFVSEILIWDAAIDMTQVAGYIQYTYGFSMGDTSFTTAPAWEPTSISTDATLSSVGSLTVTGLQGNPVASGTPSYLDVLTWEGSSWQAQPIPAPTNLAPINLGNQSLTVTTGPTDISSYTAPFIFVNGTLSDNTVVLNIAPGVLYFLDFSGLTFGIYNIAFTCSSLGPISFTPSKFPLTTYTVFSDGVTAIVFG